MACDQTEEIARLTQAFHDMDKDHDGVIDISELESAFGAVFKKAGQPVNEADIKRQCAGIMTALDKDNDSKITLEEYIKFYTIKNKDSLF